MNEYIKSILGHWYHLNCLRKSWGFTDRNHDYRGQVRACIDTLFARKPEDFKCCLCGREE